MSNFIKAQKAKAYASRLCNMSLSLHDSVLYAESSPVTSLFRIVLKGGNNIDMYMASPGLAAKLVEAFNQVLEDDAVARPAVPEPSLAEALGDDIPF